MDWMVPLCVIGAYTVAVTLHKACKMAKAWWFFRHAECRGIGIYCAYDQYEDPMGPAEGKEGNNGQNQPAAKH